MEKLQVGGLEDDFVASGLDEDTGPRAGSVDRVETPLRTMDRALASSVPIDTEFQGMPLFVMA